MGAVRGKQRTYSAVCDVVFENRRDLTGGVSGLLGEMRAKEA